MLDVDKLGVRKKDFEDYLQSYCKKHGVSKEDAMEHKIVQVVYEDYLEDGKCAVEDQNSSYNVAAVQKKMKIYEY